MYIYIYKYIYRYIFGFIPYKYVKESLRRRKEKI